MKSCLVVIDAQESFRHRPYFTETGFAEYLAAQNAAIEGAVAKGIPVVRVFHVDGPRTAENSFAVESGHIVPIKGLVDFKPAATFTKSRHSALVGTGLDVWLVQNNIGKLIVTGIRTEQCCETTTRHASDLGFKVDFVTDATHTFDMQNTDGSPLPAAHIKSRTAAVLKDRFARIASVDQALDLAAA